MVDLSLLYLRVMEVVVTTGDVRRAKLQSKYHRQQTNTQHFTAGCPSLHPTDSVKALQRKFTDSFNYTVYFCSSHSVLGICSLTSLTEKVSVAWNQAYVHWPHSLRKSVLPGIECELQKCMVQFRVCECFQNWKLSNQINLFQKWQTTCK